MISALSVLRVAALAGIAALGLSAGMSPGTAEPLKSACRVSDEHLDLRGGLDRAAARLKQDDELTILVLGSSSTAGVGATAPEKAYTERFEAELERRLAGADVEVIARGVGGETAKGAEARLRRELAAVKPDLVIWQIGTNDAARRVDVAAFRAAAIQGLKDIAAAGVDVTLLDPQYIARDEAAYGPYLAAIEAVSATTGVPVAHRFAAMRAVARAGGAEMLSRDGLHMNDVGHACVGAFLAEAVGRKLAPLPVVADAVKRT